MRRVITVGAAIALLALVPGCGSEGRKIVQVSGVVYLDGQPCKNVIVSFQPLGSASEENPGRGSSAVTDDNGRYTLVYDGEKPGVLTGKHRIRIYPQLGAEKGRDDGVEPPKNYKPVRPVFIPADWNEYSTVEFEVPSNGTDKADFKIESKPAAKK
jgi:hypothetical protein